MPSFGKTNPLKIEHFAGFEAAFEAAGRHAIRDERWSVFTREQIVEKGNSLDLGLIRDDSVVDYADLPDPIESGAGQHGEGGGVRVPMMSSKDTVATVAAALCKKLELKAGDKTFVMINGCGATTMMEMLVLFKDTVEFLKAKGVEVAASMVGEILTVQEAGGFQMNIAKWDSAPPARAAPWSCWPGLPTRAAGTASLPWGWWPWARRWSARKSSSCSPPGCWRRTGQTW